MRKRSWFLACGGLGGAMLCVAASGVGEEPAKAPSLFAKPPVAAAPEAPAAAPAPSSTPARPATRPEADATTTASKPNAAKPNAAPQVDRGIKQLDVVVAPGGDLETAYDNYFHKNVVNRQVVRNKVRTLLGQRNNPRRHDEILALLDAAIRNGQGQPWMYEAMALSLEMAKRPASEVERALMSAADFTTNPSDMMSLAQYCERLKLDTRALQLYRQASTLAPTRPEPYEHGLELARRLDDAEGIQWSSLGVLRQAWPQEKAGITQTARYAAEAAIEKLRSTGKNKEAQAFADLLAQALRNDVKVCVSWEGDADVDLMVQEPGGTICSLRDRRSTAGGVLVGESKSSNSLTATVGSSQTYLCPEGFNGTYRMLLRPVWGKIPAGKVTVEIITLNAAGEQLRAVQQIPLTDQDVQVTFDVTNGRRRQSLELQQIATDAQQQVAVNRAILAQQVNALASPSAIAAQQIANQQQTPFVTGFTPVGAVGFRPEITLLPSGATMSATAVISADRRYVRITALPFFSQVGNVSTFNVAQGTSANAALNNGAGNGQNGF
ncbi:MAG: hypothetical protein K8T25_16195 [Planctomycetia bacterium]|nr:hypothetical protein [Planctomycetia bacterium]